MNRQPFGIPPRRWEPNLSRWLVRATRRYRRRIIRKQLIQDIEIEQSEHLTSAIAANKGIMICPNHSTHYDSNCLYAAADDLNTALYFMTAWQVFGVSSRWEQWALQRSGCFSVNREGNDRAAFKQAIDILQKEPEPLVIFPEGDIYHISDYVMPFREGAAAIALGAARKADRPIVVVPCAIRFWYLEDPTPRLEHQTAELEERIYLHSDSRNPVRERILKLSEALLALKEVDYIGKTRSGELPERLRFLTDFVLTQLEDTYCLARKDFGTPERVKQIRQHLIDAFDKACSNKSAGQATLSLDMLQDMEDLFFAVQLFSYRGDYLSGKPRIERIAETLDKLEEDLLDRPSPTVRGKRKVVIRFGQPIELPKEKGGRSQVSELTKQMQASVQGLLDETGATPNRDF
ncbi:MAG: 1-acyl-sn-glycerol-3-phosphate acyltransferase [Planctomycetota bacterium]